MVIGFSLLCGFWLTIVYFFIFITQLLYISSYYKVVSIAHKFTKPIVLYRGTNAINKFIKAILIENDYCKKMIEKHFNKDLIISVEVERSFKSSNKCWICNKLFAAGDNNVRDHDDLTEKYRGSGHWNCNINLKLNKKVHVIFHNLKGYNSHLIMQEIGKFDVKISVIPNGLEKYMALTINKKLVFIDNMQFMNSVLDALVKNFSDNDFKHLLQEFASEYLKLVKQKGVYPYEYMDSFEKFFDDKLPDKCELSSPLKGECISEKDYFHTIDVWVTFKMKTF